MRDGVESSPRSVGALLPWCAHGGVLTGVEPDRAAKGAARAWRRQSPRSFAVGRAGTRRRFYLAELAKGLLAGEVGIVSGQEQFVLATSEFLLLDIKVVQRKRGNRVEITVRWPRRPLIRVASFDGGRHE